MLLARIRASAQTGGLIETESDRQEARARSEWRKAVEERVDWSARDDSGRDPSFAYRASDGCGNLAAIGFAADGNEHVDLSVTVFDRPQRHFIVCDDVSVADGSQKQTWRAVWGTVTIQLSTNGDGKAPQDLKADPTRSPAHTVIGLHFESSSLSAVRIRMAPLENENRNANNPTA